MMMKQLILILLFSLVTASSLAVKQPYIVYMGAHSHGPDATTEDFDRVTDYHHTFLASFLGSFEEARTSIIYSYTRHINGFSANIEEHHATEIEKHPSVVSVFVDKILQTQTTHSWEFMLLENNGVPSTSWSQARFGEDTIIANLDTGVWPESKSFDDKGYGPIPSKWKGTCENSNMTGGVHCNRKLIGARHFNKGYKANGGNVSKSMESARDFDGHGSHTLSTAAGNFVKANINDIKVGIAKGGSPRARVASYKVCWGTSCSESDLMAGFDMAIYDGVDVVFVSLGGEGYVVVNYFKDATSIGAFHAFQKGITVVCAAGNTPPPSILSFIFTPAVQNVAPWVITVGASTIDREFQSIVRLGNGNQYKGLSLSKALPENKLYPLISAASANLPNVSANDAVYCIPGALDPEKAKGKILACLNGNTSAVEKGMQAKRAGAAAMILCNDIYFGNYTEADLHVLPASNINYKDGLAVFEYINSTNEPMAYITPPTPKYGEKPAPIMASFSLTGPNRATPQILKPDITAPGVKVVAAYSLAVSPTEEDNDNRRVAFNILSGTSMSCPHIAGIAGLLKTHYPTWSPAAIKSAIMTTARTRDNTARPMEDGLFDTEATPFNYGAGHVRPNRVLKPGLIYDLTTNDYLDFLCAIGYNKTILQIFSNGTHKCPETKPEETLLNLNYPSITVYNFTGSVNVTRTVKNVGSPGVYVARVRHPEGISVSLEPNLIKFEKVGEEKKFTMTLTKLRAGSNGTEHKFGELLWSDGKHRVKSPIVITTGTLD